MRFRQKPFITECFDKKIYALLFVNTAEIQEVRIIPEFGHRLAEMRAPTLLRLREEAEPFRKR